FSGLLSAYGIGMSGVFASRQQGFVRPLTDDNADEIHAAIEALRKPVFEELAAQDVPEDDTSWRPVLHVRYDGTDPTLPVSHAALSIAEACTAFETAHKAQFGFTYPDRALIVETVEIQGQDARASGCDETDQPLVEDAADVAETRR